MSTQQNGLVFQGPSLLSWRRQDSNWPEDGMKFKSSMVDQVCFVGDTLPKAYCNDSDQYRWANGGDSHILGDRRGRPWTIAIRDPRREGGVVAVLPLEDTAISTSGVSRTI